jgi:two-component system phosphate regulon sensor histidine kinase PhoR
MNEMAPQQGRRRSKGREFARGLLAVAAVFIFISIMIAVASLLMDLVYARIGFRPQPLAIQIINALLGLIFMGLVIGLLTRLSQPKLVASRMGVFGPIIDAMARIAKGDFSVRLEDTVEDNPIVGVLVKSVNTMALELNQIEAMRQEFISNVSHEIQSPLTSIRGFARALQNEELSTADRAHYLTIIEEESARLSKLSDNLLKLASLDADQPVLSPTAYRLDRQLRQIIVACEPQWSEKRLTMEVSLDDVAITADEDMVSQVWTNLLHNSIKFTPQGGSICVGLRQSEGDAVFTITDTGIGIAPENQARVFERFFKADASRERARGGSGLGLAIAQKIVALHQGSIEVESTLGRGTTFTVRLPSVVRSQ